MATVGLSMIAKNEAHTLRFCLDSVQGVVSQIVVVDTGSTDSTPEIAREFGATVTSLAWENDFAKARNTGLELMTTDWVLVLDADEELDRDAKKNIPGLLTASDVGGYVTPIRNYMPSRFGRGWDRVGVPNDYRHERAKSAPSYVAHGNCRLFRRQPEICFTGKIHELVEPQIRSLNLKLPVANFFIHHFGQLVDQEARKRKRLFYLELLQAKTREHPDDATGWTQLGLHEFECFNHPEEALRCLDRALELAPSTQEAWLFKGMVYVSLGRHKEALDALERDIRNEASSALREELRGDALFGLDRFKEARLAYRRSLKVTGSNALVESKLGFTEMRLGQKNTGLSTLRRAARSAPEMYAIQDRLMKACMMVDRLAEAADAAEKITTFAYHPGLFVRAASIRAQIKQWDQTDAILARGLEIFPDSQELKDARAEVAARRLGSQKAKTPAEPQAPSQPEAQNATASGQL
jgi:tetratricopeptide (TPR) repeat protein